MRIGRNQIEKILSREKNVLLDGEPARDMIQSIWATPIPEGGMLRTISSPTSRVNYACMTGGDHFDF